VVKKDIKQEIAEIEEALEDIEVDLEVLVEEVLEEVDPEADQEALAVLEAPEAKNLEVLHVKKTLEADLEALVKEVAPEVLILPLEAFLVLLVTADLPEIPPKKMINEKIKEKQQIKSKNKMK